jgi:membrane-associated phospholipid phosphatase
MNAVDPDARRRESRIVRGWSDVALVVLGSVLLVLSSLAVHPHSVAGAERSVFRILNDHTVMFFAVVWPIMQLGNFIAVPIAALVAAATRRWRLAASILVGGVATYMLAKEVKSAVPRGRPARLLPDVHIRGTAAVGRGYISGHAAVVTLLAALAWPYLGRRSRVAVVIIAAAVCLARVYVGAHLPLDIVGGAALGLAVAGLVRLLFGRPASR